MKRNYNIDILKAVLAILIALGHYGVHPISSGIIVNCFFIMSGYFLVRSFDAKKYDGAFEYSWIKMKRIYPYYIFALVIMIGWDVLSNQLQYGNGVLKFEERINNVLPEAFLVQNIGIFDGGINYPLWQLCTLVIASHITYALLKFNRTLTVNALCPLIAIIGCSYFSNVFGCHEVESWGLIGGCVSAPLFRAFANMAVGISLYDIFNKIADKLKGHCILVLVILVYGLYYYYMNNGSYQALCAFLLIFTCCLVQNYTVSHKLFNKILGSLDKLSLSIYVNHALIIKVLRFYWKKDLMGMKDICVYIFVVILYSVLFSKVVELFLKKTEKK